MNLISVRSEGESWVVEADEPGFPRSFASGGRAERFALLHAHFKAESGVTSEVRLFLRDGSLGARLYAPAQDQAYSLAS
jgi:hypothetical protein